MIMHDNVCVASERKAKTTQLVVLIQIASLAAMNGISKIIQLYMVIGDIRGGVQAALLRDLSQGVQFKTDVV